MVQWYSIKHMDGAYTASNNTPAHTSYKAWPLCTNADHSIQL